MIAYPPLDTDSPSFPSEADLVQMMCRHVPYIEQYWVDEDDEYGYFGTLDENEFKPAGGPINEMIIRSLGDELRGYAVLYQSEHYDASVAGVDKPHLLDRLNRCIRWICAHHVSGARRTKPFEWDGQWGDDWESSLWVADIAMAVHQVAESLDKNVLEAFYRVLAFEGDRFVGVDPPDGRWIDTKEEENAWDAYLLAWSYCLLPDHPNAEEWLYRGKLFAMNTFTTDRDRVDTSPFDGRPLKDWICTQTAHPDLTVENHGSFHPGYLGCGVLLLQGRLAFQLTGRQPPPHYLHHIEDAYDVLRRFFLFNGFTAYPSGQDWTYHEPDIQVQHAVMFEEFGDRFAGHILWQNLKYLDESMRAAGDGRFNARMPCASGGRYFQFETGIMGLLGILVIAGIPDFKPISEAEFRREQIGTDDYPYVWLQVRRSKQGLFSFAWRSLKRQVMGMVVPAGGEDTLGSDQDAFVGRFEVEGERLKPHPLYHNDRTTDRGFSTTGVIEYADGAVRQSIAVVALEDGETSIVIDRTVADIELSVNEGFGLYIMNDFVNDNRVTISFDGGRRVVRGVGGKARVIETDSTWIKVAGCLGIETDGLQLLYEDAAERNSPERWKNLLQDRIFLRHQAAGRTVRDYACVIRQGRAGARRAGDGVERVKTDDDGLRAYRFRSLTGFAVVVANFTSTQKTIEIGDASVEVLALDTVVIQE
tara:strand:- start:217 stop:2322 length:2106 start_codon:yes stop_codon:yes gene_type:complete